jgi:hypothetical protein
VPPRASLRAPERAFLLGALFHAALDADRLRALAAEGLDWPALLAQAERLGLGAMVHDAVHEVGLADAVPPEPLARLAAEAARNAVQNALFANVAARTQRTLAEAGIASLALKGSAFAACAPAYQALRHQSDVDLLVESNRVDDAQRLLRALGYRNGETEFDFAGEPLHADSVADTLLHHLRPLMSREGVFVELHIHLPGNRDSRISEPLWSGAQTYGSSPLVVPALFDQLGIVCAHVIEHHQGPIKSLPRHVADVQTLLRLGASPERAAERYGPTVATSLALVDQTRLAVAAPGTFRARGAEVAFAPWWMLGAHLWNVLGGRLRLLRRVGLAPLFPSRTFMAQRYGLQGRPLLVTLVYIWRPLNALWHVLAGK